MNPEATVAELKAQLDSPEIARYVATAGHFRHELSIVLFVMADGTAGLPKLSINTRRPEKRGGRRTA